MASITGLGGAFIRAQDPAALSGWYARHLGLAPSQGTLSFPLGAAPAPAQLAFFGADDAYFPLAQKAMLNLQVDDLDAVLDRLQREGVTVDPKRETFEFGKFGWFTDPEGNRVELWQSATTLIGQDPVGL